MPSWSQQTGKLKSMVWDDTSNVIAGIGSLMSQFGDAGIAGLIALILIVSLYNKGN